MLVRRIGTPQDLEQACKWKSLAAESRLPGAQSELAFIRSKLRPEEAAESDAISGRLRAQISLDATYSLQVRAEVAPV